MNQSADAALLSSKVGTKNIGHNLDASTRRRVEVGCEGQVFNFVDLPSTTNSLKRDLFFLHTITLLETLSANSSAGKSDYLAYHNEISILNNNHLDGYSNTTTCILNFDSKNMNTSSSDVLHDRIITQTQNTSYFNISFYKQDCKS